MQRQAHAQLTLSIFLLLSIGLTGAEAGLSRRSPEGANADLSRRSPEGAKAEQTRGMGRVNGKVTDESGNGIEGVMVRGTLAGGGTRQGSGGHPHL